MTKRLPKNYTAEFKKNLQKEMDARKGETNAKRLSLKAGLGETAIRDILQNRSSSPKLETIEKIAYALEVTVTYLIPSMIKETQQQLEDLKEKNYAYKQETKCSGKNTAMVFFHREICAKKPKPDPEKRNSVLPAGLNFTHKKLSPDLLKKNRNNRYFSYGMLLWSCINSY